MVNPTPYVANVPAGVREIGLGRNIAAPKTGLLFASNNPASQPPQVQLLWTGANLVPRKSFSATWQVNYNQQNGYFGGVAYYPWRPGGGGWDYNNYSCGFLPYPTDGSYGSAGTTGTTYASGNVHYFELIGPGGDRISTSIYDLEFGEVQEALLVEKNRWYTSGCTVELVSGSLVKENYWPDIANRPDFKITIYHDVDETYVNTPADPAYRNDPCLFIGDYFWSTAEHTSAYYRGIKLFNTPLAKSDLFAEAVAESNVAQTSAGAAALWYANINPTVADITDKSGNAHDPVWSNANRPADWSEAA